jgi:putative transposase
MARLGRYFLPDRPLHVIQRGNNREAAFFCDDDYERYGTWLAEAAARHGCAIHAYVLMTNHVHLLATPEAPPSLPRLMQALGRRYVRHVNDAYRRSGTLREGRYRAAIRSPPSIRSTARWRRRRTRGRKRIARCSMRRSTRRS